MRLQKVGEPPPFALAVSLPLECGGRFMPPVLAPSIERELEQTSLSQRPDSVSVMWHLASCAAAGPKQPEHLLLFVAFPQCGH